MNDHNDWESRIGALLSQLSQVQSELLTHLDTKRKALLAGDKSWLVTSADRERQLVAQLEACQAERQVLLDAAAEAGLPSSNVAELAEVVATGDPRGTATAIKAARQRSRLLQHQSLTNWVAVQRTLLHLSQMIEVIASGGQQRPTYERKGRPASNGALVDQAV